MYIVNAANWKARAEQYIERFVVPARVPCTLWLWFFSNATSSRHVLLHALARPYGYTVHTYARDLTLLKLSAVKPRVVPLLLMSHLPPMDFRTAVLYFYIWDISLRMIYKRKKYLIYFPIYIIRFRYAIRH